MWADNETNEDLLGFSIHASLIKDVITNDKNLPVTVGLYGDWGSGKSSVLKILEKQLSEEESYKDDTIVIYFDGWIFEGYDDAKSALMQEIVSQLIENKTLKNEVKEQVKSKGKNVLRSINWMRTLQWSVKNLVLPGVAAYATGGLSLAPFLVSKFQENKDQLWEKLTGDKAVDYLEGLLKSKEQHADINAVRDFRKQFQDLIEATGKKRLVVLIDDLDRCTPRRIIDNLEAIKLFLNVDKTAFIVAADEYIVSCAVKGEYSRFTPEGNTYDKNSIGTAYMEKLIQIPYKLPRLTHKEVETYVSLLFCKSILPKQTFDTIHADYISFMKEVKFGVYGWNNIQNKLQGTDQSRMQEIIGFITQLSNIISNCLKGNPRLIKRFLNAYELRLSLLKIGGIEDSRVEQTLIKLMILEYKHEPLFKQLYDWQQQSSGKPNEIVDIEKLALENANDYPDELKMWNEPALNKLITIKPLFSEVDLRELYWVSRDKLSDLVGGASLISSKVRSLFNKAMSAATDNILQQTYIPEVKKLTGCELQDFYTLLDETVMSDPVDKKGYNLYYFCVNGNVELSYSQLLSLLSRINVKNIPVSLGNKFNSIREKYSGDVKFVNLLSANPKLVKAMESQNAKS